MPSSKHRLPLNQKDIRSILRLLPLLKSWKLVLLLIVIAFVVQYSRNFSEVKNASAHPQTTDASLDTPEKSSARVSPDFGELPEEGGVKKESPHSDHIDPSGISRDQPKHSRTNRELPSVDGTELDRSSHSSPGDRSAGILDLTDLPDQKMMVPGIAIEDLNGKIVFRGTIDLKSTLQRIDQGKKLSFPHDGTVFGNREKLLPGQARDYYREWVHPTKGISGPGPQRIVIGKNREIFYTPDHYDSFHRIR